MASRCFPSLCLQVYQQFRITPEYRILIQRAKKKRGETTHHRSKFYSCWTELQVWVSQCYISFTCVAQRHDKLSQTQEVFQAHTQLTGRHSPTRTITAQLQNGTWLRGFIIITGRPSDIQQLQSSVLEQYALWCGASNDYTMSSLIFSHVCSFIHLKAGWLKYN